MEISKWKELEELVERLSRSFHPDAAITRNDYIFGRHSKRRRQIDVSIRQKFGITNLLIVVECKRIGKKVSMEQVEAFVTKIRDVGAHIGMMVAEKGFTHGALNLAKEHGVQTYTLRDTRKSDWPEHISVKFFVETTTLRVEHFGVTDLEGKPFDHHDEPIRLFDAAHQNKEVTANDLIRSIWKAHDETEEPIEAAYEVNMFSDTTGERSKGLFVVRVMPEIKRFARDASLRLLGLVEGDGTTHTDGFEMVTKPEKGAKFYSGKNWWKKINAPFGVVMNSTVVVWKGYPDDGKTKAGITLNENMHRLELRIEAKGGKTPINFRLA